MNVCTFSISLLNKYAHVDWCPVDGEAPPRILHFNPRLKGDWTGRPVVEQNTCYRMQWGYYEEAIKHKSLELGSKCCFDLGSSDLLEMVTCEASDMG